MDPCEDWDTFHDTFVASAQELLEKTVACPTVQDLPVSRSIEDEFLRWCQYRRYLEAQVSEYDAVRRARVEEETGGERDEDALLQSIQDAQDELLKVSSGKKAVEFLLELLGIQSAVWRAMSESKSARDDLIRSLTSFRDSQIQELLQNVRSLRDKQDEFLDERARCDLLRLENKRRSGLIESKTIRQEGRLTGSEDADSRLDVNLVKLMRRYECLRNCFVELVAESKVVWDADPKVQALMLKCLRTPAVNMWDLS